MRSFARAAVMVTAAVLVLLAGTLPAHADTNLSTTGAAGRLAICPSGPATWCLYARDTLTDGHCARWQANFGSGWQWYGNMVCTGYEQLAGSLDVGQVRICRTAIGNCSVAVFTG